MTKADIVKSISGKTGIDKEKVQAIVEGAMDEIKGSLSKGENVYLRGFGTFEVKTRAAKPARNIAEKKTILVPEHKIAAFKPSKDMKV